MTRMMTTRERARTIRRLQLDLGYAKAIARWSADVQREIATELLPRPATLTPAQRERAARAAAERERLHRALGNVIPPGPLSRNDPHIKGRTR